MLWYVGNRFLFLLLMFDSNHAFFRFHTCLTSVKCGLYLHLIRNLQLRGTRFFLCWLQIEMKNWVKTWFASKNCNESNERRIKRKALLRWSLPSSKWIKYEEKKILCMTFQSRLTAAKFILAFLLEFSCILQSTLIFNSILWRIFSLSWLGNQFDQWRSRIYFEVETVKNCLV